MKVAFWCSTCDATRGSCRPGHPPGALAARYQLDMPSLADAANSGEQVAQRVLVSLAGERV